MLLKSLLTLWFVFSSFFVTAQNVTTIIEISTQVEDIRTSLGLKKQNVYIYGGTAIAVLENLMYAKPLSVKDTDVVFVDTSISENRAQMLSAQMNRSDVFQEKQVVPKSWVSGWGFFHVHKKTNSLIDIAIVPSVDNLSKNGILNIEMVSIQLKASESLISWSEIFLMELQQVSKINPVVGQLYGVNDDYNGLNSWRSKTPVIINHAELKSSPVMAAMRLIRSHIKIDAALGEELHSSLASSLEKPPNKLDRTRASRHFSYFFGDDRLVDELIFAEKIGLLKLIYPSVAQLVKKSTEDQLTKLLIRATDQDLSIEERRLARLKRLSQKMSISDKFKMQEELSIYYKKLLAEPLFPEALSCSHKIKAS